MASLPLLSFLLLTPLLGAGCLFALMIFGHLTVKRERAQSLATGISLFVFAQALWILHVFDPANPTFQLIEQRAWISSLKLNYLIGVDGLSVVFVLLTSLITPLALLAGRRIQENYAAYCALILLIEAMLFGVFLSLNIIQFYVFFEGVLIPMFFVIGLWGGERRIYAAVKFFLYSFVGSVLMLASLLAMVDQAQSSDMLALMDYAFSKEMSLWLWLGFFASFAIKTPLWPFHTWLPDAHGEAPTGGSMILAGLLLKCGLYGFIRVGVQILPEAQAFFSPLIGWLCVIGVIYTLCVALVQKDIKRLIAYTSIAHMAFALVGLFSGRVDGMQGAILGGISHGLASSGLFLGAGVLYDRYHTRLIDAYGGIATMMPRFAVVYFIVILAAIGLPGTSGFVAEMLSLYGFFGFMPIAMSIICLGLVLGAGVLLRYYGRVFYGVKNGETKGDMDRTEMTSFMILILFIVWIGLYPKPFMAIIEPTVQKMHAVYSQRIKLPVVLNSEGEKSE